jgi:integrase/recombinase XerD
MTHLSPATAGGSLRERFIADMTVRGFTDKTRKGYLRTVAGFAAFLECSPGTATAEDIRRFQIQQSELGMNAAGHEQHRGRAALLLQPHPCQA